VAAGSTLTVDVPAGALALGRAKLVNKVGWVARLKKARAKRK
jgi:bifunctional UDP-N-acetylglucosamine pyrophosphorylase/glucosamine-1-phosphate N-acetyltransferase